MSADDRAALLPILGALEQGADQAYLATGDPEKGYAWAFGYLLARCQAVTTDMRRLLAPEKTPTLDTKST